MHIQPLKAIKDARAATSRQPNERSHSYSSTAFLQRVCVSVGQACSL